jgi:hypothetical protein
MVIFDLFVCYIVLSADLYITDIDIAVISLFHVISLFC